MLKRDNYKFEFWDHMKKKNILKILSIAVTAFSISSLFAGTLNVYNVKTEEKEVTLADSALTLDDFDTSLYLDENLNLIDLTIYTNKEYSESRVDRDGSAGN